MVELPPILDFCTLYASDNFTGVPDHLLGRIIRNEKDVDDKIKLLAAYLRYMKGDKEGIINTFLSIPIFLEEAFRDRVSMKKIDAFPVMDAVNKYITNAIIQYPKGCTIQKQNSLKFYSGLLLIAAPESAIDEAVREIKGKEDALAIMTMLNLSPIDILSVPNLPVKIKQLILLMVA